MTRRTTLFTAVAMVVLAASACQDSTTAPRAATAGRAELSQSNDDDPCTDASSCSLAVPDPSVSISGNTATVTWPAVYGADEYNAKCSATTGATCSIDGPGGMRPGTTRTFTVGGSGTITFSVRAHCSGGGSAGGCGSAHEVAKGQNSGWGTETTGIGECEVGCDDDGDLKSDAVIVLTGGSFTYDGQTHVASGSCNDGPLNITYEDGPAVDVGTYDVSATCGGTTTNEVSATTTITITPAEVTATAGSAGGSYNGSAYTASGCAVTGAYTGDLTCGNSPASAGPDVGSTSTAAVVSGTGLGNYSITYVAGSIDITVAQVTATGGTGTKVYDGSVLTVACVLTGSYTGGLSCDDNTIGPDVGSGASVPVVNGGNANFNITLVNGSLSITPAPVTATAGSGSKVYDGTVLSAACVITGAYTVGISCTNADGGPNVGSTTTVPSVTGATGNYDITSVNGQIDITPASLTATAFTGNRTYGQANPTSCTVTGAVNSEVYACTSSSTANATSPVGSSWPTTATMVANAGLSNYTITYVGGTLTIVGYDLSGCYIAPIYSVMPSTKAYQKKGSVLPIKCVIRDTNGNIVSNASGDLTLKNVTGNITLATIYNAYKFTVGTPPLYMNQQDTSNGFYVVGSYYTATTKWNDGSTTTGYFYIALK